MKKIAAVFTLLSLLSFTTQEPKTVKLELTVEEVNLVYQGLGELPAKVSEPLRYKIAQEAQKQLNQKETKQ